MKPMPNLIPRFNLDYTFKDFCYGVKSAFASGEFDLSPLKSIFGEKTFLFTSYGRNSLYVILKALNLPKGSKVGVPLYSCTVVFDAIVKAGHIPCFVEIDDNYTVDPHDLKEKIEDLEVVVVIHTFGRPTDMDKIKKIAGDKPVIEDCAHSLLSEYKGMKTGTLGDASFFSLAKYISVGGGGMVIVNNDGLADRLQKEMDYLKKPSVLNNIKHSFIVYMRSLFYHRPWFGLFALPIGLSIEDKVDLMTKRSFEVASINKNDLSLMLKKIVVFKRKVEIQRKNSFFLINELKDTSLRLPYESKDTYCNYYLFPIRFDSMEERDSVSDYLRNRGVDTSKLYSGTPLKSEQHYGYKRDCPNTENIADTILVVPNHYTLGEREIVKIAEHVKGVVK
ncbi:MAG: UDP-4-amino-4-deoxy-L-arabinose--oxoglutarate aminotransferase [Candidatus Argoarchaeum ethanivorans]|uniref:UDP-4-amino-4-deoxy-L-arabinose--oxoglutarate aminotransferase n=1 Tax=Candidatus Argoarchaeum ethanivorans TaxID=2608793 RepID=A0A811T991_9EURY|nr:MAG: UDP-4-amino-4-deoxy-L-arabinose--oxoglutarate aminotransferase [Candidatus Argoarchaeum ethanivorans]